VFSDRASGKQLLLAARPLMFRLVVVAFVLWSVPAVAQERFTGKVVGVADGDTISVLRNGRSVRVRLEGIDCPEKGQDFSQRAKQFTSELMFGKEATVEVHVDRYGRLVARVLVGGQDVSIALVRAGLAWHFTKYSRDPVLAEGEQSARTAKRGLWGQGSPTPPWEFRVLFRSNRNQRSTSALPVRLS
jgi:micrococcal nuclease